MDSKQIELLTETLKLQRAAVERTEKLLDVLTRQNPKPKRNSIRAKGLEECERYLITGKIKHDHLNKALKQRTEITKL